MLWVGRLFEERYTAVRLTIVGLSGIGYLVMVPDGSTMSSLDRWLALGVIVVGYLSVWSPLANVCLISTVLAAGYLIGADNDTVPTVALAWSMFELGARRYGWQVWVGLVTGLAGCLLSDYGEVIEAPLTHLYGSATAVVVPLLLGMYIRSLGELSRQSAQQATQRAVRESERVRAEERTSIARELHDLVAHHVASIVLRVAVARNVLTIDDPRVRQVLDDVHATGSGALADLRKLVEVLRDPGSAQLTSFVDPEGLLVALDSAVERSRRIGLSVEAEIDPGVVGLDARTALAVLRLTQEGLANVAKHAGTAATVRLRIKVSDGRVEFDMHDGGGHATSLSDSPGHGLIGLRERVEVLGGSLHAGPGGSLHAGPSGSLHAGPSGGPGAGSSGAGWHLNALVPA